MDALAVALAVALALVTVVGTFDICVNDGCDSGYGFGGCGGGA